MIDYIFIFIFVISLGAAIGAILLIQELNNKYDIKWISGYFYYLILTSAYGIFVILSSTFLKSLLSLLSLNKIEIDTIVLTIPLFGIPVILTAWYLFIKFCREISNQVPKKYFTVIYFVVSMLFFLIYGLYIKNMAEHSSQNLNSFIEFFKIILILVKVLVILIAIIPLIASFSKIDKRISKRFLLIFLNIYMLGQLIVLSLLYFLDQHIVITFLFLFFYFFTEFVPAFLLYNYIQKNNKFQNLGVKENLNWQEFLNKFQISKRESEIIEHICLGKSNKEISEALFITLQTVKDHIHNIFIKIGIKNRVQLANLAQQYIKK